jgi:hypothetical protein
MLDFGGFPLSSLPANQRLFSFFLNFSFLFNHRKQVVYNRKEPNPKNWFDARTAVNRKDAVKSNLQLVSALEGWKCEEKGGCARGACADYYMTMY